MEHKTEFYATRVKETDRAILVNDGVYDIWLPKSLVEILEIKGDDLEISLPEWLAVDKGII